MNKALNEKFNYDDSVTLIIFQPRTRAGDGCVKVNEWKWRSGAALTAQDCRRLSALFAEAAKIAETPTESSNQ